MVIKLNIPLNSSNASKLVLRFSSAWSTCMSSCRTKDFLLITSWLLLCSSPLKTMHSWKFLWQLDLISHWCRYWKQIKLFYKSIEVVFNFRYFVKILGRFTCTLYFIHKLLLVVRNGLECTQSLHNIVPEVLLKCELMH